MTAATASKEGFMAKDAENAAALPWLADASAFSAEKPAPWVAALRETGAETFARTGLPTPAWEGWQYTNLRGLDAKKFGYSAEPVKFDAKKIPAPLLGDTHRAVLVDGQYQEKLSSLPEGVSVLSLMEAAQQGVGGLEDNIVQVGEFASAPFAALGAAYLRDGLVLTVAQGRDIEAPVEVLFFNTGKGRASHARLFYSLGQNSGLTLVERHFGDGEYLANAGVSIALERDSRLRYYRFMDEGEAAWHFSRTDVRQQKGSSFEGFSMATGGLLARQEFRLLLLEEAISSNIGGVYLMKGRQSHDFSILADHFEPGGSSAQHFKGVADAQARTVYQGKIHVRRYAQKTDGNQSHHALLLSAEAEASTKPELEIYADDVKCSHGATAGQLDAAALFYMRSRGIPEEEARALLVESFLNGALEQITLQTVRALCAARVSDWLAKRQA